MECDGTSRAVSTCLTALQIEHVIAVGALRLDDGRECKPHFWVRLSDGHVLDIRARMWLGQDAKVPHGIFMPQPGAQYLQEGVDTMNFSPGLFQIMTGEKLDDVLSLL